MSKIKIGIIGGGGISRAHLPQLQKRDDAVELVALADVNPEAKATADDFGIDRFVSDYSEFLDDVDAVVICVPTFLHKDIAVDCIAAGKHVFCEKPLALTQSQSDAILDATRNCDQVFQVGFVRRFDDDWNTWREAIQAGKIGRPVRWHDMKIFYGPKPPWFVDEDKGGGPFIDGCVHNYDYGLHTFGPVEWVFADLGTMREGSTAPDTGTVQVHFASGDTLTLVWSWGVPGTSAGANVFQFIGPGGVIKPGVPEEGEELHYIIDSGEGEPEKIAYPRGSVTTGMERQMDEFIASIRGEATPRAGVEVAYEANRVALAVLESGRTKQVVRL